MEKPTLVLPGGSGFLGQALARYFLHQGYAVTVLTRSKGHWRDGVRYVQWDAKTLGPWVETLEGARAVVNLAGKSVNCRYTPRNRRLIYDSRVDSTRVLGEAISLTGTPPPVWLNASTATIYRYAEDRDMTEDQGELGTGMSVNVARDWEATLWAAPTPRTHKIALRTSLVLSLKDGAFPRLLNLTRFMMGGPQGHGRQFVSWIHWLDFVRAVQFLIDLPEAGGAYNLTAPVPVPNAEFMDILCEVLDVPLAYPVPDWALELGARLIGTETELVLKSRRVVPQRLLDDGFTFTYPTPESAIEELVNA